MKLISFIEVFDKEKYSEMLGFEHQPLKDTCALLTELLGKLTIPLYLYLYEYVAESRTGFDATEAGD
jgi:hypothetical protein